MRVLTDDLPAAHRALLRAVRARPENHRPDQLSHLELVGMGPEMQGGSTR